MSLDPFTEETSSSWILVSNHLQKATTYGLLKGGLTVLYNSVIPLYSWKFLPSIVHSHWLLQRHMTSNNKTVVHQHLRAGNITKIYDVRG